MILSEVFCANLGGAATMCGDPPNIIIGTALGYTFTDFIKNTGVIIGICFVFVLIFFWLCFRKPLKASEAARPADAVCPAPATAIAIRKAFVADVIVFLIAVALLVTRLVHRRHRRVPDAARDRVYQWRRCGQGSPPRCGLQDAAVFHRPVHLRCGPGADRRAQAHRAVHLQHQRRQHQGRHPHHSAAVGRVQRTDRSLGTDLGGNATPIGASANVVATSVSAKSGHPISWGKYCKYCVPATVLVIAVSLGCLFLRYL